MKFFVVFAAILALGAAVPATWTLQSIEAALKDPSTDPAIIPYLEAGLNKIMEALMAGQQITSITIPIPGAVDKPELSPSPAPEIIEPEAPETVPGAPEIAPAPIAPEVPEQAQLYSSPLVQVVVNVNNQQ